MQIIEMQLEKFFRDGGSHGRHKGLDIVYNLDGSIHLSADVPGVTLNNVDFEMSLYSEHETLFDFVHEYLVTTLDDIKSISPELMLKMFLVGRCELRCYIDPDCEYHLIFKRHRDKILATAPDKSIHEVPPNINSPEELMVYTQYYFEKAFA
ncbi:MAG: hypothetical protein JNK14_06815 [Chitinophagaceae bacterium]|nr:hypothetical protein [Chitinophagaceae bacterium]